MVARLKSLSTLGEALSHSGLGCLEKASLEEARPQLSLQAVIVISQAKEKKELRHKELLEQRQKRKAITLGEEQIGQCGKHYIGLGFKTTHFP